MFETGNIIVDVEGREAIKDLDQRVLALERYSSSVLTALEGITKCLVAIATRFEKLERKEPV